MTLFDARRILDMTKRNHAAAKRLLSGLPVACGHAPEIAGLHGWVFEQTVQFCLRRELKAKGLQPEFGEQVPLGGRARADLGIGRILVEIKTSGLFDIGSVEKYRRYRAAAEENGCRYLFLSAHETYKPYRDGIVGALGRENVFMLTEPRGWQGFVGTVVKELRKTGWATIR